MSEKPKGFPLSDEAIKALDAYSKDERDEVEAVKPEVVELIDNAENITESKKDGVENLRKQALRKKKTTFLKKAKASDEKHKKQSEDINSRMPDPEEIEGVVFPEEDESEFTVEMPNEESIEGKVFLTEEKKGKLKSAVDLAMEQTDSIAEEYNKYKLKKEDIESAKTLDELLAHIDASEGLQGTQDYFDKEQLRMIIEQVRDGKLDYNYITRSQGLRQKVIDLLENPTPEVKPIPEYLNEEILQPIEKQESVSSIKPLENEPEYLNEEILQPIENSEIEKKDEKSIENVLSSKREKLVEVHKEAEVLMAKYEAKMKNPFKKFLANAFGVGIKEYNKSLEGFEKVRLDYQKTLEEFVEEKILERMNHLMSLRINNPERAKYEPKNFSDIEQYLNLKDLVGDDKERVKELIEKSKYGNFTLAEILKDKFFKKIEIDLAKRNFIFKILEKEVRADIVAEEDKRIDSLLN